MTPVLLHQPPPVAAPDRLWTRNFALFFGARTVSLLGDAMMPVVTALAVGAIYGVSGVGSLPRSAGRSSRAC